MDRSLVGVRACGATVSADLNGGIAGVKRLITLQSKEEQYNMLKVTSLNAYGVSRINIGGADMEAVSFSASVDGISGTYSISKSISDRETYDAHKADCDADFEAFETYVAEMSSPKE